MNREAIRQLADFIEEGRYRFAMECPDAHPTCGTAGCIGGHAAVLWPIVRDPFFSSRGSYTFSVSLLAKKLWVTDGEVELLCFAVPKPDGLWHTDLMDVTREQAVATLREWADTSRIVFRA